MMEIEPVYCDVILKRWAAHTRQQPILAATGATFTDVERERLLPGIQNEKPPGASRLLMTITEYARHRGVYLQAVQYAVKAGRIKRDVDGKINSDQADADWQRNTMHTNARTAPRKKTVSRVAQERAAEAASELSASRMSCAVGHAETIVRRIDSACALQAFPVFPPTHFSGNTRLCCEGLLRALDAPRT